MIATNKMLFILNTAFSQNCLQIRYSPRLRRRSNGSFLLCASQKVEEAVAKATTEEHRRKKTQVDLQDRYRLDLEREKRVTCPDPVG